MKKLFALLCSAAFLLNGAEIAVSRIFPQENEPLQSVVRQMQVRGKGTSSVGKAEISGKEYSYIRLQSAGDKDSSQMMANVRPSFCVGGGKVYFSALVRGKGQFDAGVVALSNAAPQATEFPRKYTLTADWQPVEFVLDLSKCDPDQTLLWVRVFGAGSVLDLADMKFEIRADKSVQFTETVQVYEVVPAGGNLPLKQLKASGDLPASGTLLHISPAGVKKNFKVKNQAGVFAMPAISAAAGLHRFVFDVSGRKVRWSVMALDKAEFAAFNAAAGKVAITEPVKILILGDSLSDFCRGYNWADILEMRLKQLNPKSRIFNYACRGDSVQTISSRLSGGTSVFMAGHYRGLRDNQYDLVIIFAGHNDTVAEKKSGFQTPRLNEEQIRRSYNTITGELKKISPAAPVVVISPVSMPQEIHEASKAPYRFGIPALMKKYDAVVRQIASANNWNYVDVYTAFDKLADGKAAYFNKDGVHINERGNLFLAMQVMESFPEFSDAVESAIENVPRWEVDTPAAGVWVLRNENSQWKGMNASGVVPISNSRLVVRKVFDLSCLPPAALEQGDKLFLRLFYGIVDNSMSKPGPKKGLNEKFYIALNGEKFIFNTSDDRFPLTFDPTKRRRQHWCDIEIPRTLLNGKTLTVELSSMEIKGDDFLYPGFDGSKAAVASSVSYDSGKKYSGIWQKQPLGELMFRLVVMKKREAVEAVFSPADGKLNDPDKIFLHRNIQPEYLQFELSSDKIDFGVPVKVKVAYSGTVAPELSLTYFGGEGARIQKPVASEPGMLTFDISGGEAPGQIVIHRKNCEIKTVAVEYFPVLEKKKKINLNPAMSAPAGKRDPGAVKVAAQKDGLLVSSAALAMEFSLKKGIVLDKITVRDIGRQIIRYPRKSAVFKIKKGSRVFTGRDAVVENVRTTTDGADITFAIDGGKCRGIFSCRLSGGEIVWDLKLLNGAQAADYTVVFPHIDGLVLSEKAENDYYLFPSGGGVIADCNTVLRSVYGSNDAWYQLIDVFSPELGGGFALRIADEKSIFKAFNLRKGKSAEHRYKKIYRGAQGRVDVKIQFTEPLDSNEGIGIAVDYQRKKLAAGGEFQLPAACFASHAGNWKTPMKNYADWGHKVWNFRSRTGRVHSLWNLWAGHGIGGPLYEDGKYHERYVSDNADFLELISYWTVSKTAPWDVPIDRIEELGSAAVRYKKIRFGYYIDPATGKYVYSYNRGDYGNNGYNPQWGGLPALQAHLKKLSSYGKTTIFYTDPVIVCPTTELGKTKGEAWGVINHDWKDPLKCLKNPPELLKQGHAFHYFSYTMCLNNPEYVEWIAKNMARLIRETGVDGIRLDEYGHGGYICTSRKHPHIFQNDGENIWMQAVIHGVKEIRKETDKFNKDVLLLAEYFGTDAGAQVFDGALSYDVCRGTSDLRPLAVNLFRFYFPECKLFELDEKNTNTRRDIWLFNAVGVYNSSLYPVEYHNILKKYNAAFNGNIEPLIDTLIPYLYANRFAAVDGSEVVYTVFNQTGHTVEGALLEVDGSGSYRYIDAFSGKELSVEKQANGKFAVVGKVSPEKVIVIAAVKR